MLDYPDTGNAMLGVNSLGPRLLRRLPLRVGLDPLGRYTLGAPRRPMDERLPGGLGTSTILRPGNTLPVTLGPRSTVSHTIDGEPGNRMRSDYLSGNADLGTRGLPIDKPGLQDATLSPMQPPGGIEPKLGPQTLGPQPGGPATQRLRTLLQQGEPEVKPLHGWKRGLEVAGDILAPRVVDTIEAYRHEPQTRYLDELGAAEKAAAAEQGLGLNNARLGQIEAGTVADRARFQAEQQRYANLKRHPLDKFLFHQTDANGNAVAVFEGPHGTYEVPLNYRPMGKAGGNHSDFGSYWQSLVASGTPDTPRNRLQARKDWEAAGRKPGSAGAKPPKLETVGAKRSQFATAKDRIQAQIANLNDQQARLGQGQGWRPAAQQKLAALQDEYRQASEQYDYWNGIYDRLTGAGHAVPRGIVAVQIPGHPVGHIPRSALSQFRKDHPDAKVLSQ